MKTIKKLVIGFFAVVVSLILLGVVIGFLTDSGKDQTKDASELLTPAATQAEPATVSKENYEAVTIGDSLTGKGGMTIDQVTAILGDPDDKSEVQSGNLKMETYIYSHFDKMISITFSNGLASGKTQTGL